MQDNNIKENDFYSWFSESIWNRSDLRIKDNIEISLKFFFVFFFCEFDRLIDHVLFLLISQNVSRVRFGTFHQLLLLLSSYSKYGQMFRKISIAVREKIRTITSADLSFRLDVFLSEEVGDTGCFVVDDGGRVRLARLIHAGRDSQMIFVYLLLIIGKYYPSANV